jgi:CxxC motif-containing protein (DUF1111 family)
MNRRTRRVLGAALLVVASCSSSSATARLDPNLGGDTTRVDASRNSFALPAPTLTNEERQRFEIGDSFFTQNWVIAPASTDARDGLGPLFNARACASCHVLDGRGRPPGSGDDAALGLLLRLSIPGEGPNGAPLPEPVYGGQLQDNAVNGVPAEGRIEVTYALITGVYADGTGYELRDPTYTIVDLAYGPLGDEVMISPRLAPQVIGMGLLEAVPEAAIVALADPDDADGDGISGRPNRAWNPATGQLELGRFGWKANQPTVEAQASDAFLGDIGITSSLHPQQNCSDAQESCVAAPTGGEPEVTDSRLGSVTFYSRTLSVPAMRDADDDEVDDGAAVFDAVGCSSCHVSTLETGATDVAALSEQSIHPYTDLLLHDMGEGLADGRPDFAASGSEWRTPPLWGLGLADDVNGYRFLLHDGRARTFEEAILWHGGEGQAAADAFRSLPADERAALIRFLESL